MRSGIITARAFRRGKNADDRLRRYVRAPPLQVGARAYPPDRPPASDCGLRVVDIAPPAVCARRQVADRLTAPWSNCELGDAVFSASNNNLQEETERTEKRLVLLHRSKPAADFADGRGWVFTGGRRGPRVILTIQSFGVLQKETKVTKTNSRRSLRASFSWLPSVQCAESDQRLAAEFISPLPLRPPVKPDSGVGLGSPSALIRVISGKVIPPSPPVRSAAGLVAALPRQAFRGKCD